MTSQTARQASRIRNEVLARALLKSIDSEGEQTSQKTGIPMPNENAKWTRKPKPKPSGCVASSESKVIQTSRTRDWIKTIRPQTWNPSHRMTRIDEKRFQALMTDRLATDDAPGSGRESH